MKSTNQSIKVVMFGFNCQSGIAVRVILVLFVVTALNIPGHGQVTYRGNVVNIRGEAVSPQLSGMVLEVLFDGVADLYYRVEDRVRYYHITDKDGRLFTLSMPPKGRSGDKDSREAWLEGIITVLKVIMKDAPSLTAQIESLTPDRMEMIKLMEDYHTAVALSSDRVIYKAPPPAFLPHFGAFAGWNADSFKPGSPGNLEGYSMDLSFYPVAGIYLLSKMPRLSENLSLILSLGAGKRYLYGYYSSTDVPMPMNEVHRELHLHNFLVAGDLLFSYAFGTGLVQPYLSGGFSTRTIVSDKSRVETDVCYDSMVISDTFEYLTEERLSLGLTVSMGLSFEMSDKVRMTTAINYSEFLITGMPGNYRSAGLTIGANFQ